MSSVDIVFEHFQNGGHEPEVVIYHHLRHLDRVKSYFIGSAHNKSDGIIGMYANNMRQLVTYCSDHLRSKQEVVFLTLEVAVAHCRPKPYVYGLVYRPVVDLNDDIFAKMVQLSPITANCPPSWVFCRR